LSKVSLPLFLSLFRSLFLFFSLSLSLSLSLSGSRSPSSPKQSPAVDEAVTTLYSYYILHYHFCKAMDIRGVIHSLGRIYVICIVLHHFMHLCTPVMFLYIITKIYVSDLTTYRKKNHFYIYIYVFFFFFFFFFTGNVYFAQRKINKKVLKINRHISYPPRTLLLLYIVFYLLQLCMFTYKTYAFRIRAKEYNKI
jgi:hypothetical protein